MAATGLGSLGGEADIERSAEGECASQGEGASRFWSRARQRRIVVWLGLCTLAAWYWRRPLFEGNFGVVDPGRVYRSAQPTESLPRWADRYGLASILNLRGGSVADSWYRAEKETAAEKGITYYDSPMQAGRRPSRRELLTLIRLFDQGPYPILVHCKKGADRTGLAVVIYRMTQLGEPPNQALNAFTLEHLHVPLFGPDKLHEPIREYAEWLRSSGVTHEPERFREWAREVYRG
jgi:protein tyrosine phosphatase (PTP) superfamily phosphohydrolase (DUF442 family)